jgi:hypothetical protein
MVGVWPRSAEQSPARPPPRPGARPRAQPHPRQAPPWLSKGYRGPIEAPGRRCFRVRGWGGGGWHQRAAPSRPAPPRRRCRLKPRPRAAPALRVRGSGLAGGKEAPGVAGPSWTPTSLLLQGHHPLGVEGRGGGGGVARGSVAPWGGDESTTWAGARAGRAGCAPPEERVESVQTCAERGHVYMTASGRGRLGGAGAAPSRGQVQAAAAAVRGPGRAAAAAAGRARASPGRDVGAGAGGDSR